MGEKVRQALQESGGKQRINLADYASQEPIFKKLFNMKSRSVVQTEVSKTMMDDSLG